MTPASVEFSISRVFDAPREVVWKAFTDAERLIHWWGPKGFQMEVVRNHIGFLDSADNSFQVVVVRCELHTALEGMIDAEEVVHSSIENCPGLGE